MPFNISFLQEIELDRTSGICFSKHISTDSNTSINYDWAWMKLPQGIQYVDYVLGINNAKTTIDTTNKSKELSKGILSPLLLLQDSATPKDLEPHICNNKIPSNVVVMTQREGIVLMTHHAGSSEGCSRALQCLINNGPQRYFELFYWDKKNGSLRHSVAYREGYGGALTETKIKVSDASFYLIPLVMSERNIVFYAIEDSDRTTDDLINFYEIISGKIGNGSVVSPRPLIDMLNPLIINDKMGILVTTSLGFCAEN